MVSPQMPRSNLGVGLVAAVLLDEYGCPGGNLFEYRGIADDFTENVDRAGWLDFAILADGGGTEEDAEGIALWPVPQVTDIDEFLSRFWWYKKHRNGEIDFVSPEVSVTLERQGVPDGLGCPGVV